MQSNLGLAWCDTRLDVLQEIHIERDRPIHRGACQLLDVWAAREAEGRFTVGRDVPSRGLARVLSGLALYEPILHGDYRVRLAGLALRRRFGRDVTGEKLSQLLDAAQFRSHAARLAALLQTSKPLVLEVRLCEDGRTEMCFELVALRVFAPDGVTPWALSGMFLSRLATVMLVHDVSEHCTSRRRGPDARKHAGGFHGCIASRL